MTWRSLIFSSLLVAWPAAGAVVSGSVRLADSTVPAVRKGQDYSGVVVWLDPARPVDALNTAARPRQARMDQKEKRFVPHVLAIQAGTEVYFPNLDPIFHSAFSNFNGQVFDLGLYAPGTGRTVKFARLGVVRIFCNIHPTMSAVIVVLKHPWFATTALSGAFQIPDVPPGAYRLHVFHERAGQKTLLGLEQSVTVPADGLALPPMRISETGYLEEPHKDKYGHDYLPAPDEHGHYDRSSGR